MPKITLKAPSMPLRAPRTGDVWRGPRTGELFLILDIPMETPPRPLQDKVIAHNMDRTLGNSTVLVSIDQISTTWEFVGVITEYVVQLQ